MASQKCSSPKPKLVNAGAKSMDMYLVEYQGMSMKNFLSRENKEVSSDLSRICRYKLMRQFFGNEPIARQIKAFMFVLVLVRQLLEPNQRPSVLACLPLPAPAYSI